MTLGVRLWQSKKTGRSAIGHSDTDTQPSPLQPETLSRKAIDIVKGEGYIISSTSYIYIYIYTYIHTYIYIILL